MPMYYDLSSSFTGSGAGVTSTQDHYRIVTNATVPAQIKGLYAAARMSTAGGGFAILWHGTATTSAGGTTITARPRNAAFASAVSCTLTTLGCASAQATANKRVTVGFAQTGGMGGWVAIEPDAAVICSAGAGGVANAYAQVASFCNLASVSMDLTVEFSEG